MRTSHYHPPRSRFHAKPRPPRVVTASCPSCQKDVFVYHGTLMAHVDARGVYCVGSLKAVPETAGVRQ